MKSRWGNVIEERPKVPEVFVSFTRNDKVAYEMIARWFGLSVKDFIKLVDKEIDEKRD